MVFLLKMNGIGFTLRGQPLQLMIAYDIIDLKSPVARTVTNFSKRNGF